MDDQAKTKPELIGELREMRQRISALEASETKLLEMERAHRQSEQRYRSLAEDQRELVCRFLPDFTITFVNEAYCRYFGKNSDELLGKSFLSVIPVDQHDKVQKQFSAFNRSNVIQTQEHPVVTAQGEFRWQQWTYRAIFDDHNRLVEFQSVGRDMTGRKRSQEPLRKVRAALEGRVEEWATTLERMHELLTAEIEERKKVEEALRDWEQKYRIVVEHANELICVVQDGRFVFANPAALERSGYSQVEVSARPFLEFVHPEDRAIAVKLHQETMEGEGPGNACSFRVIDKGGNTRWGHVSAVRIEWNRRPAALVLGIDISDLKEAEENLLREKTLSEMVIDSLPGVFYFFDEQLKLLRWNKNFEKVSGYSAEEIAEMHGLDFFQAWDNQALEEGIGKVFERGETFGEADFVAKDGSKTPYLFTGKLITVDQSPCVIGMGIDISAHKQSEQALRLSEEKYRLTFDNISDVVFSYDHELKILDVSPSVERVLGYRPQELVGKPLTEFSHLLPPEHFERALEDIRKVLSGERVDSTAYQFTAKDGRILTGEISGAPLTQEGKVVGVVSVARDITDHIRVEEALRESEQRYRTLFTQSKDGICVAGREGRLLDANQAALQMFGYSSEEIVGMDVLDMFVDSSDGQMLLGQMQQTGSVQNYELRLKKKDGTEMDCVLTANLRLDDDGTIVGYHGIVRDVTEQKKAEAARGELEIKYRVLLDNTNESIFIVQDGKFVFSNPKASELSGFSEEEFASKSFLDFVHPDDRAKVLERFQKRMRGEPLTPGYVLRMIDKHGKQWWGYSNSVLIEWEGKPAVLAQGIDITELKNATDRLEQEIAGRIKAEEALRASEARLRAIFDTATDCIFIKDSSLQYTFVNPAFQSLLGLSGSSVLGRTDEELFGPEAWPHLRDIDARVLRGNTVEEEHTRAVQGSLMTFLDIRAPLRDEAGNVVGICGISRNITERKLIQEPFIPPRRISYPSPAMSATLEAAALAASTDTTILLMGESGSGKDYLAQYIHSISRRSSGPFYSINCAAIPSTLAESELFGYEAGAFTGASRRKRGLIELAEGGTLLLNEVSELSLPLQAKLLTFLDSFTATRVGGQQNYTVDVRIISATNTNLAQEVFKGKFRGDLFYRLNVFSIRVPPLQDRLEDMPLLVSQIVTGIAKEMRLPAPEITSEILERLCRYQWPGNVRELRNVLERALIVSKGGQVELKHINLRSEKSGEHPLTVSLSAERPLNELVAEMERSLIEEALNRSGGNKQKASILLGISRFALARHMKKLGFHALAGGQ